ncbi:MAG: DUF1302 domain-containing protein [Deltaproteobacteria bacterium]|nr:DUF1302 domain-containing protein [Deltaproteobacteria bacterium]
MITVLASLMGSHRRRTLPSASTAWVLAGLMVAAGLSNPRFAAALALPANESGVTGYFDTTVSMGAAMRASGRDDRLFSLASGGKAYTFNGDDGNLNFDRGDLVSLNTKVNHELQLNMENPGAELSLFGRVLYFYDHAVADGDTERTALSAAAKGHAGRDFQLLDAYVAGDFDAGAVPVSLRLGNQVMSWGESVFLRGGINSINPADVAKLRVAGAELRDVLVPVPAANVKVGIGDSFSLEGFYQFRWEHSEIEAKGTFFSASDIVGPGGDTVHLGLGRPGRGDDRDGAPDPACPSRANPAGLCSRVARAADRDAGHEGQFGVALRYFAAALNDSEFGLYYARIHSRLPLVSVTAGDLARRTAPGGFVGSIRYLREFPEDIDLMGASFNGELGGSGVTLQAEVAYRRNQPLQVDNAELIYSALSPLRRLAAQAAMAQGPARQLLAGLARAGQLFSMSQTGPADPGQEIPGFRRKDVVQGSVAVSKALAPMLGADGWIVLAEAGFTQIQDMEDKSELRYDGTGTWTSGNPAFTAGGVQPVTQVTGFADPFSWGYRAVLRGAYSNALGPVNLAPQVAFAHDVNGTTPRPIGNFVEGRQTVTLSVGASYLLSWRAQLAYTQFFGAGQHNMLADRDFVSFTVSYSF